MAQQQITFTRIVSCSHTISSTMPHWPGDPVTAFHRVTDLQEDGVAVRELRIGEHSGTHLNAPCSFYTENDSGSLAGADSTATPHLYGNAVSGCNPPDAADMLNTPGMLPLYIIDVSEQAATDSTYCLSADDIRRFEAEHGNIRAGSFVALFSGWSRYWDNPPRYLGMDSKEQHSIRQEPANTEKPCGGTSGLLPDASFSQPANTTPEKLVFPAFSESAARLLVKRGVCGLGTDTHGLDAPGATGFPVNALLARHRLLAVECLKLLAEDALPAAGAQVLITGVKLKRGTGSPVEVLIFV